MGLRALGGERGRVLRGVVCYSMGEIGVSFISCAVLLCVSFNAMGSLLVNCVCDMIDKGTVVQCL